MATVNLKTTSGKWIPADAEVFGQLALHKSLIQVDLPTTWAENYFTVTHTPTGCAVHTKIHTKERAVQFLQEIRELDWNFDKPEQCCKVSDAVLAAKAKILKLA